MMPLTDSVDHSADHSATVINRLNPLPTDYSRSLFTDHCTLTLHAGSGGHGCVSFLREKYISAGPPNGGDGGSGGNVYVQAIHGETSLHKLARRGALKAGRGKNGRGKSKGGERGEDLLLQVPVGTVVKEVSRFDPVAEEEERARLEKGKRDATEGDTVGTWRRDKWILHPASVPADFATTEFPTLQRGRRSNLAVLQPPSPIHLDLSSPTHQPVLLAAGAIGGLGNSRFVSNSTPYPKFATRGKEGMRITLQLELKLLADVGLVGLPNAGKSTLLRAITNSRARVGNWAFTTLQPNIGTVVLDNHRGRPVVAAMDDKDGGPGINFTIADIPGLIEGAHKDRGLGLGFLRHIERARALAFVVDLGSGDATEALKALWRELGEYDKIRKAVEADRDEVTIQWSPFSSVQSPLNNNSETIDIGGPQSRSPGIPLKPMTESIASKPWFVVATKADLPDTQGNFTDLRQYLRAVAEGAEPHPSGEQNGWKKKLESIPVSAIRGEGVDKIIEWTVGLFQK
jgi:GTP-binding protein